MFAAPPDDDTDLSDDLPIWGLFVLAVGAVLLLQALIDRPIRFGGILRGGQGRHASGETAGGPGRDPVRVTLGAGISVFGGGFLVWAGATRTEIGIMALGVLIATFAPLLLPIGFPGLRQFPRSD
jgi:hypothetical protein